MEPSDAVAAGQLVVRIGDWEQLHGPASAVRFAVFVREQGIAPELELDDRDAASIHAVAFDIQGVPIATGRLLPDAHIGRMAVLASARGRGIGTSILRALVATAAARGMRELRLHAQTSAVGFYERHGFVSIGHIYEEAGIPHQTMVQALPAVA